MMSSAMKRSEQCERGRGIHLRLDLEGGSLRVNDQVAGQDGLGDLR